MVNQYYWYRMRAELGGDERALQDHLLRARATPATSLDISSAGILKSSKHKAARRSSSPSSSASQGQEIIAHSISFEYPIASGVSTAAPETPFDELQPNPITIPELGDGSTAIALLRKAGLL